MGSHGGGNPILGVPPTISFANKLELMAVWQKFDETADSETLAGEQGDLNVIFLKISYVRLSANVSVCTMSQGVK